MTAFLNIVLVYAAVYLFNQIMHFCLNMSWAQLMTKFLFDIKEAVLKKELSFRGEKFAGGYSGDMVARMGGDVDQFMNFIHWNVFYSIGGILDLILVIGFI
jgi:ABC-type multidrug transport system fused ATPase/permease subunit